MFQSKSKKAGKVRKSTEGSAKREVRFAMKKLKMAKSGLNKLEFERRIDAQKNTLRTLDMLKILISITPFSGLLGLRKIYETKIQNQKKLIEGMEKVSQNLETAYDYLSNSWWELVDNNFSKSIERAESAAELSSSALLRGLELATDHLRSEAKGQMKYGLIYLASLKDARKLLHFGEKEWEKWQNTNEPRYLQKAYGSFKESIDEAELSIEDAKPKALIYYIGLAITIGGILWIL